MDNQVVEELLELLRKIADKQIIVEGRRDKEVLCSLGFKKILTISKGIYETTEMLKGREVVVLTDFDSEGRQIAKKLNRILQPIGYDVDITARRKVGLMLSKLKIKQIEQLRGVLKWVS